MTRLLGPEWANAVISEGTLRPEDLFRAYLPIVHAIDRAKAELYQQAYVELPPPSEDGPGNELSELVIAMEDWLDLYAPAGCMLTTHPGDGACIGFFECTDISLGDVNLQERKQA